MKLLIITTIFLTYSITNLFSHEKEIVAEFTDLNNVLYVKYKGDINWTAMNSENLANPLLVGKAEPGVNIFVDHGTIAIEYYDNKNMFRNEKVKDINELETKQDFEMNSVSVFPNPTTEVLEMEFMLESEGEVLIEIFDYSGKVHKVVRNENFKVGLNSISINVSELPNSEYYVSLKVHDKKVTKLVYFR